MWAFDLVMTGQQWRRKMEGEEEEEERGRRGRGRGAYMEAMICKMPERGND